MYTSVGVVVLAGNTPKKTGASHAAFSNAKLSKINVCIDTILETGIDYIVSKCAVFPGDKWQKSYAALFPITSYPALSKGLMMEDLIPENTVN